MLSPSTRQYTARGLQPESTYLFRIAAQTRKGWGEAAEALVVTTEKRGTRGAALRGGGGGCPRGVPRRDPSPVPLADRPQPPSKPLARQEDVRARSVLLSWEPGSDGLSPVRFYTVQTRELPDGEWAPHPAAVSHNATAFVVDR